LVLKRPARRTVDGVFEGIAEAMDSITPTDALNYIVH
jgi:hypothetical protein